MGFSESIKAKYTSGYIFKHKKKIKMKHYEIKYFNEISMNITNKESI